MVKPNLLFSKFSLRDILSNKLVELQKAVDSYDKNKMLNSSQDDLTEFFIKLFAIDPIVLNEDQISVSQREEKIDVSNDTLRWIPDRSQPFCLNGNIISYHIPYEGDENLFLCQPSTYTFDPPRATITSSEVLIEISTVNHEADDIKKQFDQQFSELKRHVGWVNSEINGFNSDLLTSVRHIIIVRKDKILKDSGLVASLGFPIQIRIDNPSTYAAPISKKIIFSPPIASKSPYIPEPILPTDIYEDIIRLLNNMVLVMERSPKAFITMEEEDIRQHFLVQLNGQYEGQATGETFNYEGKTDILIRVGGKNIFIAECKFWNGPKQLIETIEQILGYACWRDTKLAILLFIRNKNFSEVIKKIAETVKLHPNIARQVEYPVETGWRFILKQRDDPNREMQLTILAFNIPITK